jgi:hypothetical protein
MLRRAFLLKITTIEKQPKHVAAWISVALGLSNWLRPAIEVSCIFIYNLSIRKNWRRANRVESPALAAGVSLAPL